MNKSIHNESLYTKQGWCKFVQPFGSSYYSSVATKQGGGGLGIYTQSVKTAWLCVGLAVKIPQ